jgi:hypothetical protein
MDFIQVGTRIVCPRNIQWIEIFAQSDPPWITVHLANDKLDFHGDEGLPLLRAIAATKTETESDAIFSKIAGELLKSIQRSNQSK